MDTTTPQSPGSPGSIGSNPSQSPVPELYPGHAADLAQKSRREAAIRAANRDPLPGPLADAWLHVPETIAGLTVRPVVHYDMVLLRALESPLIQRLSADSSTTPFTEEQAYEMILLFTTPVKEAAATIMSAGGRDRWHDLAFERIGCTIGVMEVTLLIQALEREFARAFATLVHYQSPAPESTDGSVSFPPPPPTLRTASVGGTTTSADSSTPTQAGPSTISSLNCPSPAAGLTTPGPSSPTLSPPPNTLATPTSPSTGKPPSTDPEQ